jgi:uncharacterized protein (UPF0261 family)
VILRNAANAILGMCGLSQTTGSDTDQERPLLGATMFGVTTPCVNRIREILERQGYELLVFHATGTGGQAMEQLVRDGFLSGVLDITTTEWADELVGGVLSAGPERMDAAGRAGLPQVVSVGALDMVNFGAPETIPAKFAARRFYQHNPTVTLMRTTPEENAQLGRVLAEKLNAATGPAVLLLPLGGVSAIDAPGQPFSDPAADAALFTAVRQHLAAHVKLVEMDAHINDPAFAERAAAEFVQIARGSSHGSHS